jgi:hypothetical protein
MEYMNDINGVETDKDIGLAISMGILPGYTKVTKYGINPVVTTLSDPETMWEAGGTYIYDAWGTAPIMYMSSSSTSDVGQNIRIIGLDINGYEVTQFAITTGQTNVILDTPLWRVYKMTNLSAEGLSTVGTTYVHTDIAPTTGVPLAANNRAIIVEGKNSTLMTMTTIPRGKVGFLMRAEAGVQLDGNNAAALAEFAHLHFDLRPLGLNFITQKAVTCIVGGNTTYSDTRVFPDAITELADLKMTVDEVSAAMGLWGAFELMLVDEKYFTLAFLESINQPFPRDE